MMVVASETPRNIEKVRTEVIGTLKQYTRFAQSAWYVKPVGKDRQSGKMVYAEGLSIRAAEELAQAWGNCAFSFEIIEDTEDFTDCVALFVDYERHLHFRLPVRVSKFYTQKGGGKVRHKADRFADLVMGSARSRGLREVILRCLPASLKMAYTDAIQEALSKSLDPASIKKILTAFERLGANRAQIEKLLGKAVADFDQDDRNKLAGIYSAITEGESTLEEVFGEHPDVDAKPSGAPKASATKEKAKKQDTEAEAPQEEPPPDTPEQQIEEPKPKAEAEPQPEPEPDQPDEPKPKSVYPDNWTAVHNLVRCIVSNSKSDYDAVVKWLNVKKLGLSSSTGIKEYDADEAATAVEKLMAECSDKGFDRAPFAPDGPEYEELDLEG